MKHKRKLLYVLFSLLIIMTALILTGQFDDFDLDNRQTTDISFTADGNKLSGTLVLPSSEQPSAIAIFIHGDGPQDRFSNSGYLPLMNTLVDNGIAVFSWDKAGIGNSQGHWLNQTMAGRADEAKTALALLREKYPSPSVSIGYFGFSQAGWVIPLAASQSSPDFSVIVGGAINWRDQGAFYHRIRLIQENIEKSQIDQQVAEQLQSYDAIFGINGSHDPASTPELSLDRFNFVDRNFLNDASQDIPTMRGRVLAIWGEDDLNVDAQTDACRYKKLLENNPNSTVVLVKNSTHGLLNASLFNYQLDSQWPWWKKAYFLYLGREGYTPHTLPLVIDWLKQQPIAIPKDWQPTCSQ